MGIPFDENMAEQCGYVSYVLSMEQIARCSSGVNLVLSAHTLATSSINAFGTEEQKLKYLPKC
jgi:alkylation response protein AidB-like acyl-CoA dehydrogenase